jgi:hypothetical protein
MKKFLFIVVMSALVCACTKTVEIVDPYSSGVCVGEILLGATPGKVSVSVETKGTWRIESDQTWLKIDVNGRIGDGAFTVYYESNQSDVHDIRHSRVAKVSIRIEETMKTDTLVFVQRGLMPVTPSYNVQKDSELTVEYRIEDQKDVVLVCCSSEGMGDVQAWLDSQNADIVVLDGNVDGAVEGLNVVGCNFVGLTSDQEYVEFRNKVENTYNSGPYAGDDWIYAGQMYHLSAMQTDYPNTPVWYPQTINDSRVRSDIYAWQNNLYDCVWMYSQDYVTTWTDSEEKSYSADYVYASVSVFSKITSVELIEVPDLDHKAIKIALKY